MERSAEGSDAARLLVNYIGAVTEPDLWRRETLLADILTEEFVFEGPLFEAYGRRAFVDALGPWNAQLPAGTEARLVGEVQEHHGRFLAHWAYLTPNGGDIGTGLVVGERGPDGRISRMTGFVDPGSRLPHQ